MKLLVKGKNIHVSGNIQEYAEKRLGKLSKQLDDDVTRIELEIAEEKNPRVADSHVAEVTIWTKGPTMRAREASHDIYAAIDLVAEKLQRQVLKYREKRIQYQHHGGPHAGKGRWKGALQDNGNGAGELLPGYEFTTDVQEDLMAEGRNRQHHQVQAIPARTAVARRSSFANESRRTRFLLVRQFRKQPDIGALQAR